MRVKKRSNGFYTLQDLAKLSGIAEPSLRNWRIKGYLDVDALSESGGRAYFSDARIEDAKLIQEYMSQRKKYYNLSYEGMYKRRDIMEIVGIPEVHLLELESLGKITPMKNIYNRLYYYSEEDLETIKKCWDNMKVVYGADVNAVCVKQIIQDNMKELNEVVKEELKRQECRRYINVGINKEPDSETATVSRTEDKQ